MYLKKLSLEDKKTLCSELNEYVQSVGGNRNFYELLETLRVRKPNPILSKRCLVEYPEGIVKWSKIINQDKYVLLKEAMDEMSSENFLPEESHKKYKKFLNTAKALKPITFEVQPIKEFGDGFEFSIIDLGEDGTAKLNIIFELMFFTNIDYVKKLLVFNKEG